jgi:ATP-binding cassette, subfamily B, bacterial
MGLFRSLLSFYELLIKHVKDLVLATIFSILNRLFDIAPPALIGVAVDIVVRKETSLFAGFGITSPYNQLWVLVIITIIIWFLESYFEYRLKTEWWTLAQTIQHNLRMKAYRHIQTLDISYLQESKSGNLLTILNDDVNQLERFLNVGANDLIQFATTFVAIGSMYIIIVPQISWMIILSMPFVFLGSLFFQRLLAIRYARMREQVGVINDVLANNIAGIATIKSYVTEKYEQHRVEQVSNEYRARNQEVIKVNASFIPIIRMIIVFGFSGILLGAGFKTLSGNLEVGVYSVLIFMSQRLLWPLTRLGDTIDLLQRATASLNRVKSFFTIQPEQDRGNLAISKKDISGEIDFRKVSFTYNSGLPVLHNINFKIKAGETLGLVGATGSGKTTIANLILRFYDPTAGEIYLDGKNLVDIKKPALRNSIGYVSQDIYLFNGTIRENLIYGSSSYTTEFFETVCKAAQVDEFVIKLPQGYDTLVGERGIKLSGGQRQRICIARALLKDASILIFDEATSAVDNETESLIRSWIDTSMQVLGKRTKLIIAHRLSTVMNADRILVIDAGVIKEEGNHQQLLDLQGMYAKLWRLQ